ncbi:hypothetical protein RZN28_02065, partial [Klebsiella pneumoniae]|nr:hypothetical protein [Klebsiella pneumoniae]
MQGESFLCLEPQSHPVNAHNMDGQPGISILTRVQLPPAHQNSPSVITRVIR